jgi:hypothetical protein
MAIFRHRINSQPLTPLYLASCLLTGIMYTFELAFPSYSCLLTSTLDGVTS